MLKKKSKGVAIASSKAAVDDEAKFRRQYQHLLQDFPYLLKEAEAKKNELQEEKQRKNILHAEVRFLRRRYEELIQIRSTKGTLAKPDQARNHVPNNRRQAQAKPNPLPVIDLNQISNEDEEEAREVQFASDTPRVENYPPRYPITGRAEEQRLNDLNKSLWRSSGSGSNRSGKRKITWQDQVVLRA